MGMTKDEAFELAEEIMREYPHVRVNEFLYDSRSGVSITVQGANDRLLLIHSRQNWNDVLTQITINLEWRERQDGAQEGQPLS